jgi:hypothetical protein
VCGYRCIGASAMTDHTEERHGCNWPEDVRYGEGIPMRGRVKEQMEFVPHLTRTPWGSELR